MPSIGNHYEPGPGSNESCSCGRGPVISALLSSLVFERSGRAVWYGDSDSETHPQFHVGGHTYQAPSSLPFSYTVDPVTVVREPCRWLREAIALTIHSPPLRRFTGGTASQLETRNRLHAIDSPEHPCPVVR